MWQVSRLLIGILLHGSICIYRPICPESSLSHVTNGVGPLPCRNPAFASGLLPLPHLLGLQHTPKRPQAAD